MVEEVVGQARSGAEGAQAGGAGGGVETHPGRVATPEDVVVAPADPRSRPLVLVHTGEGKGKTTAAMGLALRGWAQGWSIGVVQFIKSGKWPMGERAALLALGRLHEQTGQGGPVHWYQAGAGWTWSRPSTGDRMADAATLAADGWARAAQLLAEETHDLLILDELTYPMRRGWVDADAVAAALTARPGRQHVVVTGRGCPEQVREVADLVTEMGKVRHPYDAGVRGQRGIEW